MPEEKSYMHKMKVVAASGSKKVAKEKALKAKGIPPKVARAIVAKSGGRKQ